MSAPESPAEALARAVARMRADAERCGDAPESFVPAVADLLEAEAVKAARLDGYENTGVYPAMLATFRLPLAIARGYLSEAAGAAPEADNDH